MSSSIWRIRLAISTEKKKAKLPFGVSMRRLISGGWSGGETTPPPNAMSVGAISIPGVICWAERSSAIETPLGAEAAGEGGVPGCQEAHDRENPERSVETIISQAFIRANIAPTLVHVSMVMFWSATPKVLLKIASRILRVIASVSMEFVFIATP